MPYTIINNFLSHVRQYKELLLFVRIIDLIQMINNLLFKTVFLFVFLIIKNNDYFFRGNTIEFSKF